MHEVGYRYEVVGVERRQSLDDVALPSAGWR